MKTLACILSLTVALALAPHSLAQAKKKPADAGKPAETAKPAADAKPGADPKPAADAKPAVKAAKPLPFDTTADEIDATAKTFTHTNKDGKVVKFNVTPTTVIKQGEAEAKFEDIKKGDSVAGLRVKKNDDGTEYDVVKITKFGAQPEPKKAEKGEKGEPKKPAEPKKK